MSKIFITTTLPYSNGTPHIGHSLEFIQADALSHYFKKIKKDDVFFNIGLDEHGLKIWEKSNELNMDTQEYLDAMSNTWLIFCEKFQIKYDNFYRTTDLSHIESCKKIWMEYLENGDLYKKIYSGKYCQGCESFKTESDLIDGKCIEHDKEPIAVEEENWFFKISKYTDLVHEWYRTNVDCLKPKYKSEELKNIILQAKDISVSRLKENVPWGIEVPNDIEHTMYCWFSALLNYIFAANYDKENEINFWNSDTLIVQLFGPDNLRFQGSLFQSMLEALTLPHSHKLLMHGTVLDADGKKMSKTMGNVIDPMDQLEKYGLDAVRYYTLAGLSTYGNSAWSEKDLIHKYNSDLADDYGNLIARVLHLIDSKNIEVVGPDKNTKAVVDILINNVKFHWQKFEINTAINETNVLIKMGNKYINDERPWEKDKKPVQILSNLYYILCETNKLYSPVLSTETFSLIEEALKNKKKVIAFKKIEL